MKPQHRKYWEEFKDHTLFKHRVLEAYAHAWMQKVARGRGADRLLVVDAFAGRGGDKQGNPGSPLRLAQAAALAAQRLAKDLDRSVTVKVVAIEQEREWFEELRGVMASFGDAVEVLHGTLDDYMLRLSQENASVPALYFLDPFGVQGLGARLVEKALGGEANEVLVLFNDAGAIRLAGAAGGLRGEDSDDAPSLFDEIEQETSIIKDEPPSWPEGGASREILNIAFGGVAWEQALAGNQSGARRNAAIIGAYEAMLHRMGAPYTTRIPVLNSEGFREYTLVHASKSPHGRQTMKECVVTALNACPLPEKTKELIRMAVKVDLGAVEALLSEQFAGREVYLTGDHDITVRKFVLMHTGIFPTQIEELKSKLTHVKLPGPGPVRYRFT